MKKVLLPQPIHEAGMQLLEGKVEIIIAPDNSEETMHKLCKDIQGIILRTTSRVSKEVIAEAKGLQIISRTGARVDNVDVQAATRRGILVCNLPGVNSLSVAEHTVAFILALVLDEDGNALYPAIIHWDRRSVKQAKEALAKVGKEKFLRIAGNIPYPGGISVTSILWLK